MHVIAAKATAFLEALQPSFKEYQAKVLLNAKAMASVLNERGYGVVSGGTDNHLMLVSLVEKDLAGNEAESLLHQANITVNKNSVPNDPRSPMVTSGLRIGTPAITTRGFGVDESISVATYIADILDTMSTNANIDETIARIKAEVKSLCEKFPVYT